MKTRARRLFPVSAVLLAAALAGACNSGSGGGGSGAVVDTSPPAPIGNLQAAPTFASGIVQLTWTASTSSDVAGYRVTWTPSGGETQPKDVTPGSATGTTVTGLADGTGYTFQVLAFDASGNFATTPVANNTPVAPSGTPPDTTAPANAKDFVATTTGFAGQVSLAWTPSTSSDVDHYALTWTPADGETQPKNVTPKTATGTTVSGLTTGTTYTFSLVAVDTSNNVAATPVTASAAPTGAQQDTTPPADVTNLAAEANGLSGQVVLSWTPSTSADISHYEVTWAPAQGEAQPKTVSPGSSTGTTISGLTDGTNYTFTVRGVDFNGNKTASPAVTSSPGDATILVQALPSGGVFPTAQSIIFNANTAGTITYSINGDDPTLAGPLTWGAGTPAGTAPIALTPGAGAGADLNFFRVKYRLVTATGASTIRSDIYELYPAAAPGQRFFKFAGMRRPRIGHTATQPITASANTDHVVVVGGFDGTDTGSVTGQLTADGEVFTTAFEHFEPVANKFTDSPMLLQPRWWHAAAPLAAGKILICGGQTGSSPISPAINPYPATSVTDTTVIYDAEPTSATFNRFIQGNGVMQIGRFYHTATRLYSGQILIVGGLTGNVVLQTKAINSTPSKTNIELPTATALSGVIRGSDYVEVVTGAAAGQVSQIKSFTDNAAGAQTNDSITVEGFNDDVSGGDSIKVVASSTLSTLERFDNQGNPVPLSVKTIARRRWGHTATLLDDGRVFIVGGDNDESDESVGDLENEIYDPSTDTIRIAGHGRGNPNSARLSLARQFHSATKLLDGRVLIAGGLGFHDTLFHSHGVHGALHNSAEIFDPITETMRPLRSQQGNVMSKPRAYHGSALLCDGRVLLVGGWTGIQIVGSSIGGFPIVSQTADLFDPISETFTPLTPNDLREHNVLSVLGDCRVLVSGGGLSLSDGPSDLAEIFLPRTTQFAATAHGVGGDRTYGAIATLLADGRRLLLSGGQTNVRTGKDRLEAGEFLATAEIYNLSSIRASFTTSPMTAGRRLHTATLLLDTTTAGTTKGAWHGQVLVAGGENATGGLRSCDRFDPVTGQFSATGPLSIARWDHTATLLPDGRVLVTGGGNTDDPIESAELYLPAAGSWVNASGMMTRGRTKHTAVLLPAKPAIPAYLRGKVLIAGGNSIFDDTVEVFDPTANTFSTLDALKAAQVPPVAAGQTRMRAGRRGHSAALRTFAFGFAAFTNGSATVGGFQTGPLEGGVRRVWNNPATGRAHLWPAAGDMIASLSDGTLYQVAAVGGDLDGAGPEDSSLTLTAAFTGATTAGYQPYTLFKGDALVAGGEVLSTAVDTFSADTAILAGATGTFEASTPMGEGRHSLTLVALPHGEFLIAGGLGGTGTAPLTGGRVFFPPVPAPFTGAMDPAPPDAETAFDAGGRFAYHMDAVPANSVPLLFRSHSAQAFLQEIPPPDVVPPDNVTNLSALATGFSGQVQLSWNASGSADVARYEITWAPATGPAQPVVIPSRSVITTTIDGLVDGTLYTFTLVTIDRSGNAGGAPLPTATATPNPDTAPPDPPSGLTAVATGATGVISLTWTPSTSGDAASYRINWSPDGGETEPKNVSPGTAAGATVAGLGDGTTYTFEVRTVDRVGNVSTTFATASAAPATFPVDTEAPKNVTGLTAAPNGFVGQISLSWSPSISEDVDRYEVTWRVTADPNAPPGGETQPKLVRPRSATGTVVTLLTNGTGYTFTVVAIDAAGNRSVGPPTAQATPNGTTTDTAPPIDVSNLSAVATGFSGEIRLTWSPSASADVARYDVEWVPAGGETQPKQVNQPTATGVSVNGLSDGVRYTFTVKAVDTTGNRSTGVNAAASPGDSTLIVEAAPSGGVFPVKPSAIFNFSVPATIDQTTITVRYTVDGTEPTTTAGAVWANSSPLPAALDLAVLVPASNFLQLKYRLVANDLTGVTRASSVRTDIYESFPVGAGVNPRFVKFAGMRRSRVGHTAVRLATASTNTDDVAVIGGRDLAISTLVADVERFNALFEHFEPGSAPSDDMTDVGVPTRWNHAAALLPGGQVLVAGGQLEPVSNSGAFNPYSPTTLTATTALYDGEPTSATYNQFRAAGGAMGTARFYHSGTRLFSNQVLLAGGQSGAVVLGPLATTNTSPSKSTMFFPIATALSGNINKGDFLEVTSGAATGQIGTVTTFTEGTTSDDSVSVEGLLTDVAGGDTVRFLSGRGLATAELFSAAGAPVGATTSNMVFRRWGHSATLLDDGTVFIVGGVNDLDEVVITDLYPEIFDRTQGANGSFRVAGIGDSARIDDNRFFHSATKLKDGKVLIAGGMDRGDSVFHPAGLKGDVLSSADLYDPVTETTKPVGSMTSKRYGHSATLLDDGRVLLVGGITGISTTGGSVIGQTADVYDPKTFSFTGLTTNDLRGLNVSITLGDGRGLVMGGGNTSANVPSDLAELFLPVTNQFVAAAHGISGERTFGASATVLQNGRHLLLAGGQADVRNGTKKLDAGPVLASSELYNLSTIRTGFTGNNMVVGRRFHSATLLLDTSTTGATKGAWHGKILIAGGENESGGVALCELYNPSNNLFSSTGPLAQARWNHTATLIPDRFYPAGALLPDGTVAAADTLFPDGRVLVTGGGSTSNPLASAELYLPAPGSWVNTSSAMVRARTRHTATWIPNKPAAGANRGKILIIGGSDLFDTSAELFDPVTNTFAAYAGTVMSAGRRGHAAALRSYTAGFARFTNTDDAATPADERRIVRGFRTRWSDSVTRIGGAGVPDDLLPAPGDLIASLADGTLYTVDAASPDPRFTATDLDGAGPEDASITLSAPYTGTNTAGYQPYLVIKNDIFVAGGEVLSATTDTYEGASGNFVQTAGMTEGRHSLTVIATSDGRILVAGGIGGDGTGLNAQQNGRVYTPAAALTALSGAFSALTVFDANYPYSFHMDARPANGQVLIFRAHSAQVLFQE